MKQAPVANATPAGVSRGTRRRRAANRRSIGRVIDTLETRRLLCGLPHELLDAAPTWDARLERAISGDASADGDAVSIVWSNRGQTSGSSNDRFNDVFGANAAAARAVVDAALADWANVITSWNRSDGTTTLQVNISMAASGADNSANATPTGSPSDGRPRTGVVTIGRGGDTNGDGLGDGGGWYIDPFPTDSAEFTLGDQNNAYAGGKALWSSATPWDLYTVVNLEMVHVLGLTNGTNSPFRLRTSNYLVPTQSPDFAEGGGVGYYYFFNGPTIQHLMTSNNGGASGSDWGSAIHTAGAAASVQSTAGPIYVGGEDSGNAIYENDTRYLPNEVVARILADAYGYSIKDPKTIPTIHAQLDNVGNLIVRGRSGNTNSADDIRVTQSGSTITVSVNIGNDVAGSGHLPGAGNLSAYVATFNAASVNNINVYGGDGNDDILIDVNERIDVDAGAGNDNVTLRAVGPNTILMSVVNGGQGNDTVTIGDNGSLERIDGTVSVNGAAGEDKLWVEDDVYGGLVPTYTVEKNRLLREGMGGEIRHSDNEHLEFWTGSGSASFYVRGTSIPTTLHGMDGSDTFFLGNIANSLDDINGNLAIEGGANADSIRLLDTGFAGTGAYNFAFNSISRIGTANIAYSNAIESIHAASGSGGATFNVFSAVQPITILGGEGPDTFKLGSGSPFTLDPLDANVSVNGEGGTDAVYFKDNANSVSADYTITSNTLTRAGIGTMTFNGVEAVTVAGGNATDTFFLTATGSNVATTIRGGNSSDYFYVASTGRFGNIDGTLTIDGEGGGSDQVEFHDEQEDSGRTYSLTDTTVSASHTAGIALLAVERAFLYAGNGNDVINVTPSGTVAFTVDGRGQASGGQDRLNVNTSGTTSPAHNASQSRWTFGNRLPINYANIELQGTANPANLPATVTGFAVAPHPIAPTNYTFRVSSATDPDGSVVGVDHYLESNGTSGWQSTDLYLGRSTDPSLGYLNVYSSTGWPSGTNTAYARAIDNEGLAGTVASTTFTVGTVANVPPTMSGITAAPNPVVVNGNYVVTANNVADSDGTILAVYFYRESNGISGFQSDDALLGTDTNATNGYSVSAYANLAAGTYTLYSRALDDDSEFSSIAIASLIVTPPANGAPQIGSLAASAATVQAGNPLRLTAGGVSDGDGNLTGVSFYRETNGTPGLQISVGASGDTLLHTDTTAGDGFFADVNTSGLTAGSHTYYAVARDAAGLSSGTVSATSSITVPTGPMPYYSTVFIDQPLRAFFLFPEDVGNSLGLNDITVTNLSTGAAVQVHSFTWDAANRAAIFYMNNAPADGSYRVTLIGSGIWSSTTNTPMSSNASVDFRIFRGDANHDGSVNFDDLLILARNYGKTGQTFTNGNFDFSADGSVNFNDLLLLAKSYGTTLPAAPAAATLATTAPTSATRKRSTASEIV